MDPRQDDELLLRRVGDALREPDVLDDPRWDALAAGELDEAGVAELRALALRDPEARAAFEVFQPLDDATHAALESLFRAESESEPAPESEPAEVVSISRHRRYRWAGAGATILAVAAALILMIRPSASPLLAPYQLEVGRGEQAYRSAAGEPADLLEVTPATRLDLVLRPATRVDEPVGVEVFLREGGDLRGLDVEAKVAPGGAIEVTGVVGEVITDAPGRYDLVLVVGRRAEVQGLPTDARALPSGGSWQVFVQPLEVRDE